MYETGFISTEGFIDEIDEYFDGLNCKGKQVTYSRICGMLRLGDIMSPGLVYMAAQHAQCGFKDRYDTQRFMLDPIGNSMRLSEQVCRGKYRPQYYATVVINERGKERTITPPQFACKVVQKCLSDMLLRPLYMPKMISTSYASVPGRGTDLMSEKIQDDLNHAINQDYDWSIVTTDFTNYFGSIPTKELCEVVYEPYIRDMGIIDLLMRFSPNERGLSLGNETSQVPATFYPSSIDHYVKDELGYKYHRFMDDTLAIVPTNEVDDYIAKFREMAHSLGLSCDKEGKVNVIKKGKCFTFCKEHYDFVKKGKHRYQRKLNPSRASRELNKLRSFYTFVTDGKMTLDYALEQARSTVGSIKSHPRTKGYVENLNEMIEKLCSIDGRDANEYTFALDKSKSSGSAIIDDVNDTVPPVRKGRSKEVILYDLNGIPEYRDFVLYR